jgi:hypothetical protein
MKNLGEPMAALDSTNFDKRYASLVSHGPVPIDGLVGSPQTEHALDWSNSVHEDTEATRDTAVHLSLPARTPGMPRRVHRIDGAIGLAGLCRIGHHRTGAARLRTLSAIRSRPLAKRPGRRPGLAETPAALGISPHIPSEAASAVHSGVR